MERTDDSTVETDEYADTERQGIVDHYTTLAIQMILADPWVSVPVMVEYMLSIGPWSVTGDIVSVFRGRVISRSTMNRLNSIRIAVLQGNTEMMPITTEVRDGSKPGYDEYVHWWAPYVRGEDGVLFPIDATNLEGEMAPRYPRDGSSTEEMLQVIDSDASAEDMSENAIEEDPGNDETDILM